MKDPLPAEVVVAASRSRWVQCVLRTLICAFVGFIALVHAAPSVVGEVSFVRGLVVSLSPAATGDPPRIMVNFPADAARPGTRTLREGDAVFEGELLAAGPSSHLHIRTADGGFLALRPDSTARIEVFAFDPQRPSDTRIRLILERGVIRSVSGAGAQASRERFRLNTPLAAIGIRGTDFTVESSDYFTRVAVHSGEVVVSAFNAACRPDRFGPCLGATARALSGDDLGGILELRRGETQPRFLQLIALEKLPQPTPQAKAGPVPDSSATVRDASSAKSANGAAGSSPSGSTQAMHSARPQIPDSGGSGAMPNEDAGRRLVPASSTPSAGVNPAPTSLSQGSEVSISSSGSATAMPLGASGLTATTPTGGIPRDTHLTFSEAQQSRLVSKLADRVSGGVEATDTLAPRIPPALEDSFVPGGGNSASGSFPPPAVALTNWGRWADIAGLPRGLDARSFLAANESLVTINQAFFLTISDREALQMPTKGSFAFSLRDAQAWETRGGTMVAPAAVDRGQLSVDFAAQRFATELALQVGGKPIAIGSVGRLLGDGTLEGRIIFSDPSVTMNMRGSLAGKDASQAAYLFDAVLDSSGKGVVGATSWTR